MICESAIVPSVAQLGGQAGVQLYEALPRLRYLGLVQSTGLRIESSKMILKLAQTPPQTRREVWGDKLARAPRTGFSSAASAAVVSPPSCRSQAGMSGTAS